MSSRDAAAERFWRRPRRIPTPTPAGWRVALLTVGLAAAAVNTGNNLIYLMFSLLAAALPVSIVVALWNLGRLRCTLQLPSAPRVGCPFTIDVEFDAGRKRTAVRAIAVSILTDQGRIGPVVVVERVAGGDRARVSLTARGTARGTLRILAVRVTSMFPLGLLAYERRLTQDRELVVLPSARGSRMPDGTPSRESGASLISSRAPGTEYAGLRRGNVEDDVRKVDWKITARRGVTIVRETVGESGREHHRNVVTRSAGDPVRARRGFEERVSQLAGQAQRALEHGDTVHITVDGAGLRTYVGRNGLLPLLRRLARLVPTTADGSPLPPLPAAKEIGEGHLAAPAGLPRRALRVSALVAVGVGSIALFAGAGIGPIVLALLLGSVLATGLSSRLLSPPRSIAGHLWRTAAVLALTGYVLDILLIRHDLLAASLSLTVFITLFALYNVASANDDRRLLLVSLLHMVLAVAMTTEVVIAVPLLVWLLATVHGLMAWTAVPGRHCRGVLYAASAPRMRYAAPAFGAWAAMLVGCFVLFLIVPHFGTGAFRPGIFRGNRATGFSDTTTLGDIGRIKLDQSKVMEIDVRGTLPDADDLRWRGLTLNEFDGRTWTRSYTPYARLVADHGGEFHPRTDGRPGAGALLHQEVRLESGAATAVFSASQPTTLVSSDFRRLVQDAFGNLEFPAKPVRRLAYSVTSELPPSDAETLRATGTHDPLHVRAANLQLPRRDSRIATLARQITANAATRYDAALAIEDWLSGQLTYSLEVRDQGADDPLARFLFDGMAGHCEYFATAMVVLARELEIPTRFVAGYLRGEKSRFGQRYLIRQSNAHSWVEVHFPDVGWVPFDPTPPVGRSVEESAGLLALAGYLHSSITRLWDDYLVGIDLDDQARGLLVLAETAQRVVDRLARLTSPVGMGQLLPLAAIALLIVPLLAMRRLPWRRLRRHGRGRRHEHGRPLPSFYRTLSDLLSRRGLSRVAGETPAEFAGRAAASMDGRSADRLRQLTDLYYRVRFDGVTTERDVSRIARALVGDVRAALAGGAPRRRPASR